MLFSFCPVAVDYHLFLLLYLVSSITYLNPESLGILQFWHKNLCWGAGPVIMAESKLEKAALDVERHPLRLAGRCPGIRPYGCRQGPPTGMNVLRVGLLVPAEN